MAIKYSATLRNGQLDVITAGTAGIGASGKLRIYSGSRPANVAAAITGTLLAELTLNATFAAAATGGVLTANAITGDTSADSTGTASHFPHLEVRRHHRRDRRRRRHLGLGSEPDHDVDRGGAAGQRHVADDHRRERLGHFVAVAQVDSRGTDGNVQR